MGNSVGGFPRTWMMAIVATLLATGCAPQASDTAPPIPLVTTRDSAGVTIVEFPEPMLGLPIAFQISDTAVLDFGGERRSPVEELSSRVTDFRQLSTGAR